MQKGFVENTGAPMEGELELINKQARRALSADEVYVFSVVLCDNEIDRDFERFTIDALQALAKLYVGKSGIFDHSMKGRDQVARIFSCKVEAVEGQRTADGQPYYRLKARAYMPRCKQNEAIILEIDSGIKREVSVGCAVGSNRCSVCGSDRKKGGCVHIPGHTYRVGGKEAVCHTVLDAPRDAYEWSFVAVPAQPAAGVVKAFGNKEVKGMEDVKALKSLKMDGEIRLTAGEAGEILRYIEELKKTAETAGEVRAQMVDSIIALYGAAQPELPEETLKTALSALDEREVKAFLDAARKNFGAHPAKPQLCAARKREEKQSNAKFMI